MPPHAMDRKPHAILDPDSRAYKARKIDLIIKGRNWLEGGHVLDIGTGSGFIAEYFCDPVGPNGSVTAIDRLNQLQSEAPIDFFL